MIIHRHPLHTTIAVIHKSNDQQTNTVPNSDDLVLFIKLNHVQIIESNSIHGCMHECENLHARNYASHHTINSITMQVLKQIHNGNHEIIHHCGKHAHASRP